MGLLDEGALSAEVCLIINKRQMDLSCSPSRQTLDYNWAYLSKRQGAW